MAYVALYLSCMALGYFLGNRTREKFASLSGIANGIMLVSVSILVFLMGIRMGSNEEIIQNLGNIGLMSLLFTVVVVTGGILSVTAARKLFGIDKYGRLKHQELSCESEALKDFCNGTEMEGEPEQNGHDSVGIMTFLIVIFVVLGILFGYFYIRVHVADVEGFNADASYAMTAGLCVLMASIGFDMGRTGTVAAQIKQIGARVLIFPIAVIIGTGLSSAALSLFLTELTLRECLAIGFGFGWYTFAPVTISGAGHVMAGAVSFMHNVIRETCGIILIPILAKRIGYIEVCSLPGVASADIGVTLVEKSTRADIIIYSFAIGISESLLIPFLVTVSIGA